jgi:hypothetical protein
VITQSPRQRIGIIKRSASGYESGANKRARYWLGEQAANITNGDSDYLEDDDINVWNNDFIDPDDTYDGDDFCDDYDDEADDESDEQSYKGPVRGISEEIAASMDLD